jgi:hypothetical protein
VNHFHEKVFLYCIVISNLQALKYVCVCVLCVCVGASMTSYNDQFFVEGKCFSRSATCMLNFITVELVVN